MGEILKWISIYGLGTVAGAFLIFLLYLLVKWFLNEFRELRKENREAFAQVVKMGTRVTDAVENHMETNTKAVNDLARLVERLCRLWDINSKG